MSVSPPLALPESVQLSLRDSLKLNAWAGVGVVVAFAVRLWLGSTELTGAARAAVALLPLLPGLLYVRALHRWMLGLDEMQSRLQFQAVGFALLSMLLVALGADLLRSAGFGAWLNFGWEGYFAFTFLFYTLGLGRANRRVR